MNNLITLPLIFKEIVTGLYNMDGDQLLRVLSSLIRYDLSICFDRTIFFRGFVNYSLMRSLGLIPSLLHTSIDRGLHKIDIVKRLRVDKVLCFVSFIADEGHGELSF